MNGGSIYRCPDCQRLVIYGQTCICGNQTSRRPLIVRLLRDRESA